jgi:hypothetical protein
MNPGSGCGVEDFLEVVEVILMVNANGREMSAAKNRSQQVNASAIWISRDGVYSDFGQCYAW